MRQTIKEIESNYAYRWFIGYDIGEDIPHFQPSEKTTADVLRIRIFLKEYLRGF